MRLWDNCPEIIRLTVPNFLYITTKLLTPKTQITATFDVILNNVTIWHFFQCFFKDKNIFTYLHLNILRSNFFASGIS